MSNSDLLLTPGGYREPRAIQEVTDERGFSTVASQLIALVPLSLFAGNDRKPDSLNDTALRLVADHVFSALFPQDGGDKVLSGPPEVTILPRASGTTPLDGSWRSFADWNNMRQAVLVQEFRSTWFVPPEPAKGDASQTIFLFNGAEYMQDYPKKGILQPVLQWGKSAAGGGRYWSVACWAIDHLGYAYHTPLRRVKSGDKLTGIIAKVSQGDDGFGYMCYFDEFSETLYWSQVPQLHYLACVLETYDITSRDQLPSDDVRFTEVTVKGASGPLKMVKWSICNERGGRSTAQISTAAPNASIAISFREALSDGAQKAA